MAFTLRKRTSVGKLASFRLEVVGLGVTGFSDGKDGVLPRFLETDGSNGIGGVEMQARQFQSRAARLFDLTIRNAGNIPPVLSEKVVRVMRLMGIN